MELTLFNPLPTALAHYAEEMVATLGRIGIESRLVAPKPGIDAHGASRARRIAAYVRAVRTVRANDGPVLVLWPATGWLELLLWRGRKDVAIVVHDPVPLRSERGHSAFSRAQAGKIATRNPSVLICHTEESAARTRELLDLRRDPPVCFHPILSMREETGRDRHASAASNMVLVAGQYKPTRDMDLLHKLGPELRTADRRPVIAGRGWPEIAGWEVTDRFLSESELEQIVAGAGAVLLPYRRYWQSGIAIRALEAGVPVVGASTPFLRELVGESNACLVKECGDSAAWLAAIDAALASPRHRIEGLRLTYQEKVDRSWRAYIGPSVKWPA
jgi:glycosyltransferase involved in cell wall biosynthesis